MTAWLLKCSCGYQTCGVGSTVSHVCVGWFVATVTMWTIGQRVEGAEA